MQITNKLETVTTWDALYEEWADSMTTLQAAQDNLDEYHRRHLLGYEYKPSKVLQEIVLILREQEWAHRNNLNNYISNYQLREH